MYKEDMKRGSLLSKPSEKSNVPLSEEGRKVAELEKEFLSLLDQVGYPSIIPASGVSGRKITRKEDVLSVVESAEAAFAILNDLPKDEPPLTYDQLQKFSEQYLEKSKNKSQFQAPPYPFPNNFQSNQYAKTFNGVTKEVFNIPVGSSWNAFAIQFRRITKEILGQNVKTETPTSNQNDSTVKKGKDESGIEVIEEKSDSRPAYYHAELTKEDAELFGYIPMKESLVLVKCNHCHKVIRANNFAGHMERCRKIPENNLFAPEEAQSTKIIINKRKIPPIVTRPKLDDKPASFENPNLKKPKKKKKPKKLESSGENWEIEEPFDEETSPPKKKKTKKERKPRAPKKSEKPPSVPNPPVTQPSTFDIQTWEAPPPPQPQPSTGDSSYSTVVPPPPLMTVPVTLSRPAFTSPEQATADGNAAKKQKTAHENIVVTDQMKPTYTLKGVKNGSIPISFRPMNSDFLLGNQQNNVNMNFPQQPGRIVQNPNVRPGSPSSQLIQTKLPVQKMNVIPINVKSAEVVNNGQAQPRAPAVNPNQPQTLDSTQITPQVQIQIEDKPKGKRSRRKLLEMQRQQQMQQGSGTATPGLVAQPMTANSPEMQKLQQQLQARQIQQMNQNLAYQKNQTMPTTGQTSNQTQNGYVNTNMNGNVAQNSNFQPAKITQQNFFVGQHDGKVYATYPNGPSSTQVNVHGVAYPTTQVNGTITPVNRVPMVSTQVINQNGNNVPNNVTYMNPTQAAVAHLQRFAAMNPSQQTQQKNGMFRVNVQGQTPNPNVVSTKTTEAPKEEMVVTPTVQSFPTARSMTAPTPVQTPPVQNSS